MDDIEIASPECLTLKELQQRTNAYDEFKSVETSPLPQYYKDIFPKKCQCGGEFIIDRRKYTRLQCCNPACWIKWSYRLSYFISYFGYKGFGDSGCRTLISASRQHFKCPSFLSVFFLTDFEICSTLTDSQSATFLSIRDDLQTKSIPIQDAIASLGINEIGKNSKLFDIVKDTPILIDYILRDRTDDLCDAANIFDTTARFSLSNSRYDILLLFQLVNGRITSMPKNVINIAITGKVTVNGTPYTRSEFLSLCENIKDSNGSPKYKLNETKATSKLDYVIADEPSASEKYRIGEKLGILITADKFYQQLTEQEDLTWQ